MRQVTAVFIAGGLLVGGIAACSTGEAHGVQQGGDAAAAAETAVVSKTMSFVATDIGGNHVTLDLGRKNPGKPDIGDLVAFTQNLATGGKNVGQVHVIAAVVDHKQHLSEATGTIVLKDGSIQLAGVVSMDPTFTLTVTGGTGDYVGATGTMSFDASGNDQIMKVELN